MKYTSFSFKNFRGISEATLDISRASSGGRIFTLVGLNESGKTTVLEAIDHFQASDDEVSPKQLAGWIEPERQSLIPVSKRANFNGAVEIQCTVELDDEDVLAAKRALQAAGGFRLTDLNRTIAITDRYEFVDSRFDSRRTLWSDLKGTGMLRTGRVEKTVSYAKDRERWNLLTKLIRERLPTIWYFPNFLFDFPERIYLEPIPGESDSNRFFRSLFQDVLDALDRDLTIEDHVISRFRSSERADEDNLNQVLVEAGRHVTKSVVTAWNQIFGDSSLTQKSIKIDLGEEREPWTNESDETIPTRVWARFQLDDADGLFSIDQRSLGFRWFFVYLLITTYRGSRRAGERDMLFLFDEPASNLHPNAQSALLKSLSDLSKDAMIFYTTHSHHLIEPRWLGTTFVVSNQGLLPDDFTSDYTSKLTDVQITPYREFASKHPDQTSYFKPVLDVLDFTPSQIEPRRSAVMLEGKSDFYLLELAKQMNSPDFDHLNLLPSTGAGSLALAIQLYLAWGWEFLTVLDGDATGRREKTRYIDKFGAIVERHVHLLPEVLGDNSITDIESLLSEEDRLLVQKVAAPTSDEFKKKLFLRGLQEAVVTETKVPISKAGRDKLREVLAMLDRMMPAEDS